MANNLTRAMREPARVGIVSPKCLARWLNVLVDAVAEPFRLRT